MKLCISIRRMETKVKKIMKCLVPAVCAILLATSVVCAAYYNQYETLATIPNGNGCNKAEGFTAGSTYLYCAKVNNDESKQVIYRTKQSDGTTTLMTNGDTSKTYTTTLGHANDMVTTAINGTNHLFVATMKSGSESLVNLSYAGNTYYQEGSYTLKYNGQEIKASGIEVLDKDDENIYFLIYEWPDGPTGKSFYKATIGLEQTSGVVELTHMFDINYTDALVNGKVVSNIDSFRHQGVGYKKSSDKLYVPFTKDNVSIILVYNNISTANGTITADSNLSFRITSSNYSYLFEIESCDNANGKLWFNCNRKTESSDTAHDAICYFKDYALE